MKRMTFEDIILYYPTNQATYDCLKNDIKNIIPFVGAGLSCPWYPLWPEALNRLSDMIYNQDEKKQVKTYIESKPPQFLQAAQKLVDSLGKHGLEDGLFSVFKTSRMEEKKGIIMSQQAAWLLPHLFGDKPAITTNFDRVMETVYEKQNRKFDAVILPGNQELQNKTYQGNRHALFKIHGDIGNEMISYSSIVFTEKQYDRAYRKNGQLVRELKKWFGGKMLLFLGCSLETDKTIEVLQSVIALNHDTVHYAVIECQDENNIDRRVRHLRETLGIKPIVYPHKKHEAVRILLEKLMEDIDNDTFQQLEYHIGALPTYTPSEMFEYQMKMTEFVGRDEEMKQLTNFCENTEESFLWWALTGPGGAGKSRLALEFSEQMQNRGWRICRPKIFTEQFFVQGQIQKTLVIIDYVQAYAQQIGMWLEMQIDHHYMQPVRVLLIERDGTSLSESSWGETLKRNVRHERNLERLCWQQQFMQLTPLKEKQLMKIMQSFVRSMNKELSDDKARELYDILQDIDPSCQPLYAMIIAYSWVVDDKPKKWNKKAIMDHVLKHENDYFHDKFKEIFGTNKKLELVINDIRIIATIWSNITIEQIKENYQSLYNRLENQESSLNNVESINDILHQLGLTDPADEQTVKGLVPDLIGEYYVLKELKENRYDLLFKKNWEESYEIQIFISRVIIDYYDVVKDKDEFWNRLFVFNSKDKIARYIYCVSLGNITCYKDKILSQKAITQLKNQYESESNDENIARQYCRGLVNFMVVQKGRERQETVKELQRVYEVHERNEDIALGYIMGLFYLAAGQEEKERRETVKKMQRIYGAHEQNQTITFLYARILVNLIAEQEEKELQGILKKLQKVYKAHECNEEIAIEYVKGLVNFTIRQKGKEECHEAVMQLQKVYETHVQNEEIAIEYVKVLFDLTAEQKGREQQETVKELQRVYEAHEQNEEIALMYVESLFNLAAVQDGKERHGTAREMRRIYDAHGQNKEITLVYAKILVNLIAEQKGKECQEILKELKKVYEAHNQNEEIALGYAKVMFIITVEQKGREECRETVKQLQKVYEAHDQNEGIALMYVTCLFILFDNDNVRNQKKLLMELVKVHQRHEHNEMINIIFNLVINKKIIIK